MCICRFIIRAGRAGISMASCVARPISSDRHAHLSSPLRALPAGHVAARTVIIGGAFDRIVRLVDLEALRESWPGSELLTVPQAHFGYGMIPEAVEWLGARHLLAPGRS